MSLQIKNVLLGIFLCLAIGVIVVAASSTLHAFQRFQQQNTLVTASDVSTIRPWMTIPYVAHVYHVPEGYLYQALKIPDKQPLPQHVTLHSLASHYKRSVGELIHTVQAAIQTYRKHHPYKHRISGQLSESSTPGRCQIYPLERMCS